MNSLETINTDQNTAISIIQGVDLGQNATITAVNQYAAAAYAQANTNAGNITVIQGVDLTQNTRIQSIETINSNQNTSISVIQGVDLTQNTQIAGLQGVDLAQNSAISITQGVDATQNTRMSIIEGVDLGQNTTITAVNNFAQSAYNTANGANGLAAGAYNTANTKFNSSGGTISGPVIISANNDLTVTGNLVVLGTTSSVNTETLEVIDPMIILGIGNYTTDAVDIGFAGHYNDGANAHTGLIRDYATKEYFLFQGYTPELSGNNNVDINHVSFSTANLNAKFIKGNVVATTAVINGVDFTASQTTQNTTITAVNNFAAGAFDRANNSVLKSGDTMSGSLTGVTTLGATTISLAQVDATSNTFTTASTAQVSIDAWPTATYRAAKYFVQITSGSAYHIIELNLVHNGTTVFLAQYGEVLTGSSLGTFDADISGATVRLLFTGVNAVSTIKVLRTVIDV